MYHFWYTLSMIAILSFITFTQQIIPDFSAREINEAKAKGWILSDRIDEQGIRRRAFIEKKGKIEVRQGFFASWFKDGKPRSIIHFRDGIQEGETISWYANGNMASKGLMHQNKRSGRWITWNPDAIKSKDGKYVNGSEHGKWDIWYSNGKLAAKGGFRDGLQNGSWQFFKSDGSAFKTVTFTEGLVSNKPRDRTIILPPKQPPATPMVVKVDLRMELLAIVQSLTDWPSYGAWDSYNDPYQQDVAKWFGKFKTHPAVVKYNAMLNADTNFAFDGPVKWVLHYTDPPEFKKLTILPKVIAERGGSEAQLDELAELMRQFVVDTKFMEFVQKQERFYKSLLDDYAKVSPGQEGVQLVSDYYGETRSSITAIICPLFGGGNYGPQIEIDGKKLIYNVGAPNDFINGKFTFEKDELRSLVFHEFGHSFSNPGVDESPQLAKLESKLFPGVSNRMSAIAYGSWDATCYELFNRTHEIRLLELSGNPKQARKVLADYLRLGFVWLPYTLNRLHEFESNRTKYPTIHPFMPRLTSILEETEPFVVDGVTLCVLPK